MDAQKRRHIAVMFTDVAGYTSLMEANEEKAIELLQKNRRIHQICIENHNGVLIKEMGDGCLVSFDLASDAVRCAKAIQHEAHRQTIPLKIGIHEGEMMFHGKDILGDGVNVASRLQEMGKSGCIYISEIVYHDIKNKSGLHAKYIGENNLKGISKPVKVYEIFLGDLADKARMKRKSNSEANKKSIIVLPFENMSPDPDQEYFSDGLTEEIITDLSYIENLLVISRSSAMTFKGSNKKITDIAREVNVRYVLEGSVRKAGNNLRIIAQLIDAETDTHLWAEKYTGTLDDIFDIQEQVSRSIADSLKMKLGQTTEEKLSDKAIKDPYVYELYLKARYEDWQFNEASLNKGEKLLQEGLKLGGENALLYAELSHTYVQYVNNLLKDPESYPELLDISDKYAKKALKINPNLAVAHYAQGLVLYQSCNPKAAIQCFERAITIEPNHSESMLYLVLGFMYAATGLNLSKSFNLLEKGKKLDPVSPVSKTGQGWRLLFTGEYQEMVDEFEEWKLVMEEIKSPTSIWFAWLHGLNKDFNESFRIIEWVVSHHPGHIMASLGQFMKYAWLKEKDKALATVNKTLEMAVWWDDCYSLNMAEGYAVLEEYDEAFRFLNRAIDYGFTNIDYLTKYDHFLENLRSDKRFGLCLKKAESILDSLKM